jgi:proteic killer suppression protein
VIKSFADEETRQFWETGRSAKRPPANLRSVAKRKLQMLEAAVRLDDLKSPPGNKPHPLEYDRAHQHAIWINDQWRLVFTWRDGDAYDVEITDYH